MAIDFSSLAGLERADFYFLRHGESDCNVQGIVQGRLDCRLSRRGRLQAEAAAAGFRGLKLECFYSSPLSRGLETARIIAAAAGLAEPEACPELMELDTGVFTGLTLAEAERRFPEMHAEFLHKSWDAVEGAEDSPTMQRRAEAAWKRMIGCLAGVHGGRACALAVAHAGILQWIVKCTVGNASWFPLFPMGNCALFHFSVQGSVTRWESIGLQNCGEASHVL